MSCFDKDELAAIHEALVHEFDMYAQRGQIHMPLGDLIGKVADLREEAGEPIDEYRLMTLAELSELECIPHDRLRRAAYDGRLNAVKSGATWLSTPADVTDYLQKRWQR